MFSGLRQGATFYVLDKSGDRPALRVGQVASVSNPAPRFNSAQPYGMQTEQVVDVTAKFPDGTTENYTQLPTTLSIANFGKLVVSESRDAMAQEVETMKRNSADVLASMDYHKGVIEACEGMTAVLNPGIAKEREQEQKIAGLETKINGMEGTLTNIQRMLSDALAARNNQHKN